MKNRLSASEALYGFVAWLSSREERVSFSSHDSPRADLISAFIKANELSEPREDWAKTRLVYPKAVVKKAA